MGLVVTNLVKRFGSKVAVDHLSLQMEEPGVFGLIGTNGAGKTTSIRMILGIMSADEGSSAWNGTPISRDTLSFGYMPEERGIYMKNKVLEQLVYFGMLRGMIMINGTNGQLITMEQDIGVLFGGTNYLKLYFGQTGMDIEEIRLICTETYDRP